MKAFIGLLHLLGEVALTVPELWVLTALAYKELEESCDDPGEPQFYWIQIFQSLDLQVLHKTKTHDADEPYYLARKRQKNP